MAFNLSQRHTTAAPEQPRLLSNDLSPAWKDGRNVTNMDVVDRWTTRIETLRGLRNHFAASERYERANRAHQALQRAYNRWAHEVLVMRCNG
jgi:hypothetical protein